MSPLHLCRQIRVEMEKQGLYLEERRDEILRLLDSEQSVNINDLSVRFEVSAATIRKDIRALEREGKLRRTHGGAIPLTSSDGEIFVDAARSVAHKEKARIGRMAARFVSDGDTILVQSGSTCLELVKALEGRRDLTLITCDMAVAMEAEAKLINSTVIIIGGALRIGYHYAQGPEAIAQLERYHVPTAFLGCNALSISHGVTAHRVEQANWVQAQLRASDRHIMLMDSSKLGVCDLAHAADLSELDVLVTDTGVPLDMRARFTEEAPHIEILYA